MRLPWLLAPLVLTIGVFFFVPAVWWVFAFTTLGGISGVLWAEIQVLDQRRITKSPDQSFLIRIFAYQAFGWIILTALIQTPLISRP